jgi:hypothetical protein
VAAHSGVASGDVWASFGSNGTAASSSDPQYPPFDAWLIQFSSGFLANLSQLARDAIPADIAHLLPSLPAPPPSAPATASSETSSQVAASAAQGFREALASSTLARDPHSHSLPRTGCLSTSHIRAILKKQDELEDVRSLSPAAVVHFLFANLSPSSAEAAEFRTIQRPPFLLPSFSGEYPPSPTATNDALPPQHIIRLFPTGTADLLGALALVKPVGAAEAEPVLAMAVGFDLPGQDGEVIIKLASGTRLRISWEAFKQGRRELFGKDLSDLDVPAWGPDDDLPLSNTSKKAKEAQDKSSSSESDEPEYSSSSDSDPEAASAVQPCQHLSRKRPLPSSLSPNRRASAALPHQSSEQSAALQGPQKKSVAHFKSLPQSTPLSFVKPNPKRSQSKSRSRYDAYMGSTSIAEFIMSGGSWADLVFDEAKGHCTVGNAPSEAMDISQQEC